MMKLNCFETGECSGSKIYFMISRAIANRSLTLHAHAMFVMDITSLPICCRPEIRCQNLVMNN